LSEGGAGSRVSAALRDDPWAIPTEATPEDTFGRLFNNHGVTAANIAKYDAVHSIIVFSDPDPLAFTRESVVAHLALAQDWVRVAHDDDPAARYPYIMWNCLWRAGGSIVHGHTQVSLARGRHYAKIERLRADAERYRVQNGVSYFEDLVSIHTSLGLAHQEGHVSVLANLTPLKEKECLLIANSSAEAAATYKGLGAALFDTLRVYRDTLGVRSFNVGILLPPVDETVESWEGFPVVVRIVDRGSLETRTSDIGGMEMFAESVVAADPFAVHRALVAEGA
jgi:galactose-1-phosphate uridylyltransferase